MKTNKTGGMWLTGAVVTAVIGAIFGACSMAASVLHQQSSGGGDDLLGFGGGSASQSCVEVSGTKISSTRPVDIIFVVDDSGSMTEELDGISKNINEHFADVMGKAGLDYRVIMVVLHGQPGSAYNNMLCVEAPLSTIPKGGCAKIGSGNPGINPGKFYHYSYDVESNNSLCLILDTLVGADGAKDAYGLAPYGWIKWLRKSAFKVLIEVTDDAPMCIWYPDAESQKGKKNFNDFDSSFGGQIIAQEWEKQLLKIAPDQFGTKEKRNYVFYSIVGMLEKPGAVDDDTFLPIDPNGKPDDFFTPSEGVVGDVCSTAVASGFGYQWLSKITGGLRFPVCQSEKFDEVFEKIATSIDTITSTVCDLELPQVGSKGTVDVSTVNINVTYENGDVVKLKEVDDVSGCTGSPDEFYYDKISSSVSLCPETCLEVKSTAKDVKLSAACVAEVH